MQDVEFTVEDGKLWMLQTRSAKRTPRAALSIAIDLVHEGLIDADEGLTRIADIDLDALVEVSLASEQSPRSQASAPQAELRLGAWPSIRETAQPWQPTGIR